jgi:hypothetical protein
VDERYVIGFGAVTVKYSTASKLFDYNPID